MRIDDHYTAGNTYTASQNDNTSSTNDIFELIKGPNYYLVRKQQIKKHKIGLQNYL